MPRYSINMPFAGYFNIEVEAENEEQAIEKAFEADIDFKGNDGAEVLEVEYLKHITRGNVCYAPVNSYSVEEIDGDE